MAQNSKRGWAIWGFSPETSVANSNLRAKKQFTNKFNFTLFGLRITKIVWQHLFKLGTPKQTNPPITYMSPII
jgi:hypothetical protein